MNYIPIRIGTLRPDDVIDFDVFVFISDHYVHYIRKSDPFEGERIHRLKSKGLKKLFIPEDSEPSYLSYLDRGLDRLKDKNVKTEDKAALLRDSMVTDAENSIRNVQTEEGYKRTQDRMAKMVQVLTQETNVLKTMISSSGCSTDIFQHCATVSSLALTLAGVVNLNKPEEQLELGLASLFHDIGHTKLGFNALIPQSKMSVEQLGKYKEHPKEGARMLADKPYITKGVLDLIVDHEEVGDQMGFPNKKRLSTLSLSQQVLNLCNDYDRYSMLNATAHADIVKGYFQDRIGVFDMNHMKALFSLLK